MTYDEMMAAYLAAGGLLGSRNADAEMSIQQAMMAAQGTLVQMPDGRFARVMPDGSIVAADRSADGGTQNLSMWSPGAQEAVNQSRPYDDNNWQRSLAGALAVGVGGPALGIMGNAIQASLAPAAAAAAPTVTGGATTGGVGGVAGGAGLAGATGLESAAAIDAAFNGGVLPTAAAGGIDWAALAPAAGIAGAGGAGALGGAAQALGAGAGAASAGAAGGLDWTKLLGPALGAGIGALGSGDRTVTTQTLMDPSARAYLDSFRSLAERVAQQPYQAPGFSLTQDPTAQQTAGSSALQSLMNSPQIAQYQDVAGAFASGARDGSAAGNAEMDRVRGLVGQGTAAGTAAGNAEMDRVRGLVSAGSAAAEAARNAYFGQNPYLDPMIQAAQGDLSRAYANTVAPKFASGSSFGNSGLGFAEVDSRNDLMRNLGRISSDIRFGDYNLQANLGEQFAGRQDAMANANRAYAMQGAGLLGNFGEAAAGRADSMFNNNAARALQGAGVLGNLGESAATRADSMFNSNANRALQGVQLGQQGLRDQANMANNLFTQGTALWGQGQQNIANQYQEFQRQQDWAKNQLSAMNPGLGVGMTTGQSQTTPGNPWAGAAGGAITGAQIARWLNG